MPAESSLAACVNADDDDEDGLMNCDDPDCWGFAACAVDADTGLPPTMPPVVPPQMPGEDDPGVPPPESMTDGSAPLPLDSSTPDVPDTGSDAGPPIECEKYCPDGECNADGSCHGPLEFGTFDVASVEVLVPLNRTSELCFDYGLECPFSCCPPDPTVSMYLSEEKVVLAPPEENAPEATWEPADFEASHPVLLREGDEVRFEVFDDDFGTGPAQLIFECATLITRSMIDAGMVGCEPADLVPPPESDARYFVAAYLAPQSGALADDDEDDQGEMP